MYSINYKFILRIPYNIEHVSPTPPCSVQIRISQTVDKKTHKKDITIRQMKVHIKDWDATKQRVKPTAEKAKDYNILLTLYDNKINQYLLNAEINNSSTNIDELVDKLFKIPKDVSGCFYTFGYEMISTWKGRTSNETLRHYKASLSKLKKFAPKLFFKDITFDFLSKYEYYMRNELNNGSNTVVKSFFYLKQIWKAAIDRELTSGNPFEKIKVRKTEPKRSYLTPEELHRLEEIYNNNQLPEKLQNSLKCFLFQCYTGLRYGELKIFTLKNIVDNQIIIKQPKVERTKYIPLSDYSRNILKEGTEFHIISNQKYNEHMKLIALSANIDKPISTHTARHTFATVSLSLGIDIRIIADILGHGSLNNIKWYTHIYSKIRDDAMEKWNHK